MTFITESYKNKLRTLAGLDALNEEINFTRQDLSNAYDKSGQRISGFNKDLIQQAIKEGRAIGVSYKSSDMPVTKFRVILPVTLGEYNTKSGIPTKLSAFHLAGQSEKAAGQSGTRSQETANVWRLFDLDTSKFKGMWLTDSFFYEYPPGYKKGDRRFNSVSAEYDIGVAEAYKIQREDENETEGEPIDLRNVVPQGDTPTTAPENSDKPSEGIPKGAASEDLYETSKNALFAKKPWLKFLRPGYKLD